MTMESLWAIIVGPLAAWNLKIQTQTTRNEAEIGHIKTTTGELKDSIEKLHDKMDRLTEHLVKERQ